MKNAFIISIILISLFQFFCNKDEKIDVTSITIDNELSINHNPSQSIDSIIILNTRKNMELSGDSIYAITTAFEKRRIDSLMLALSKTQSDSILPPLTHQTFTLNENSVLSIFVYDSLGNKVNKIIDSKLVKGAYEIYFNVFSFLRPGEYFVKISSPLVIQCIKLKVI